MDFYIWQLNFHDVTVKFLLFFNTDFLVSARPNLLQPIKTIQVYLIIKMICLSLLLGFIFAFARAVYEGYEQYRLVETLNLIFPKLELFPAIYKVNSGFPVIRE